jgi:DNA-binding NarL/FixJ family response regulator
MTMPGMGRSQTLDAMREVAPNIKVLLASGCSVERQAQLTLARGCNGFIQKPSDVTAALAALLWVVTSRRGNRAWRQDPPPQGRGSEVPTRPTDAAATGGSPEPTPTPWSAVVASRLKHSTASGWLGLRD